jgi:hypothetical protein
MQYEDDTFLRKYKNAQIYYSCEGIGYYWEEPNGVVGGEDFDNIDDCLADIDAQRAQEEKALTKPMAYIDRY